MNNKMELITVKKVLEQMKMAEECMMKWDQSWMDRYLDAYCPILHYDGSLKLRKRLERIYNERFDLTNACANVKSIGVPLATFTLTDGDSDSKNIPSEYEVDFGQVDWIAAKSNKATRAFSFKNNGIITFSKETKNKSTSYSYFTSFNVMSDDFNIVINHCYIKDDEKYEDVVTFSRLDDKLTIMFNKVGRIIDLETGDDTVKTGNRDYYDRSIIEKSESKAIAMIRDIRGELPLPGLIERINNGLNIICNKDYKRKTKRTR